MWDFVVRIVECVGVGVFVGVFECVCVYKFVCVYLVCLDVEDVVE